MNNALFLLIVQPSLLRCIKCLVETQQALGTFTATPLILQHVTYVEVCLPGDGACRESPSGVAVPPLEDMSRFTRIPSFLRKSNSRCSLQL